MAENQEHEIYFTLKAKDKRIQGFSGCNSFTGNYILEKGNQIHFEQLVATTKLCQDVDVNKSTILNIFNTANNCTITGDILTLNGGASIFSHL